MLVLTVREGQKIHIGDEITVSFYHSYDYERRMSDRVKICTEAPDNENIIRSELIGKETN